jgi:protein-L-isoaspartate(D-aspartate) O-methyltransferase
MMKEPVKAMLETIDRHAASTAEVLGRDHIDPRVMAAVSRVPREQFVPADERHLAHGDHPLPIGHGQTISQPFIVAFMTDLLDLQPAHRVLEVGTGCGYQAAVLAELADSVDTIEVVPELAAEARAQLVRLGYANVRVHVGDGRLGLEDRAPFDRIIVTAAPERVPEALTRQLAPGGRLVIPVGAGPWQQTLLIVEKDEEGRLAERRTIGVAFVPLVAGDA